MKTRCTFICLLPVILLTGCVGLVLPVPSGGRTYGKIITREQTQFIVGGQTTRAEVEEKLGYPLRDSPRLPALAYAWEQPAAGLLWFWVIPFPPGAGDGGYTERSHWRAFFVEFDGAAKVKRSSFVSLSGGKSLDEQLEQWAGLDGKPARKIGVFFNPDTGAPCFVEAAIKHMQAGKQP